MTTKNNTQPQVPVENINNSAKQQVVTIDTTQSRNLTASIGTANTKLDNIEPSFPGGIFASWRVPEWKESNNSAVPVIGILILLAVAAVIGIWLWKRGGRGPVIFGSLDANSQNAISNFIQFQNQVNFAIDGQVAQFTISHLVSNSNQVGLILTKVSDNKNIYLTYYEYLTWYNTPKSVLYVPVRTLDGSNALVDSTTNGYKIEYDSNAFAIKITSLSAKTDSSVQYVDAAGATKTFTTFTAPNITTTTAGNASVFVKKSSLSNDIQQDIDFIQSTVTSASIKYNSGTVQTPGTETPLQLSEITDKDNSPIGFCLSGGSIKIYLSYAEFINGAQAVPIRSYANGQLTEDRTSGYTLVFGRGSAVFYNLNRPITDIDIDNGNYIGKSGANVYINFEALDQNNQTLINTFMQREAANLLKFKYNGALVNLDFAHTTLNSEKVGVTATFISNGTTSSIYMTYKEMLDWLMRDFAGPNANASLTVPIRIKQGENLSVDQSPGGSYTLTFSPTDNSLIEITKKLNSIPFAKLDANSQNAISNFIQFQNQVNFAIDGQVAQFTISHLVSNSNQVGLILTKVSDNKNIYLTYYEYLTWYNTPKSVLYVPVRTLDTSNSLVDSTTNGYKIEYDSTSFGIKITSLTTKADSSVQYVDTTGTLKTVTTSAAPSITTSTTGTGSVFIKKSSLSSDIQSGIDMIKKIVGTFVNVTYNSGTVQAPGTDTPLQLSEINDKDNTPIGFCLSGGSIKIYLSYAEFINGAQAVPIRLYANGQITEDRTGGYTLVPSATSIAIYKLNRPITDTDIDNGNYIPSYGSMSGNVYINFEALDQNNQTLINTFMQREAANLLKFKYNGALVNLDFAHTTLNSEKVGVTATFISNGTTSSIYMTYNEVLHWLVSDFTAPNANAALVVPVRIKQGETLNTDQSPSAGSYTLAFSATDNSLVEITQGAALLGSIVSYTQFDGAGKATRVTIDANTGDTIS